MTTSEQVDMVLEAYHYKAISDWELKQCILLIITEGEKLTKQRLLRHIVGSEIYEDVFGA